MRHKVREHVDAITDILARDRKVLIKAWLEKALQTYPPKTSEIFKNQKDPFANPIGATLSRSLEGIFDELLLESSTEKLEIHLRELVKVRAVQDFTPSGAISFLLDLKRIVRQRLAAASVEPGGAGVVQFEERVDLLCLFAFDLFMQQREEIWKLRSQELKQRTSYLLRKKAGIESIQEE